LPYAFTAEVKIPKDYIVELDPLKVSDVRLTALRLVGGADNNNAATVEATYEHALYGFNVANASAELLAFLLDDDEVLVVEEVSAPACVVEL